MADRTPLGSLGKLPFELRWRIYKRCVKLKVLHLLQVNTTIYAEYLEAIQSRRVFGILHFHIDPSKQPSTIDISTQYGRPCGSIDATSLHLHDDTNPIRTMPIGRYRTLKLKIDAPDPKDFCQTFRLCKQVSAFVASLSPCQFSSTTSGVPSKVYECPFPPQMKMSPPWASLLCVYFVGIEKGCWGRIARWFERPYVYPWGHSQVVTWTDYANSVFAYVLRLLQQLYEMPTCLGAPPAIYPYYYILGLNANIGVLSSIEDHFGLNWGRRCAISEEYGLSYCCKQITFDFDDFVILRRIHALQAQYELLVDEWFSERGKLLRQERFLTWCGLYYQYNRVLWKICSWPSTKSNSTEEDIHPLAPMYGTVDSPHSAIAEDEVDEDPWDEIGSSSHGRFWARTTCDPSDDQDGYLEDNERKAKRRKCTSCLWT